MSYTKYVTKLCDWHIIVGCNDTACTSTIVIGFRIYITFEREYHIDIFPVFISMCIL